MTSEQPVIGRHGVLGPKDVGYPQMWYQIQLSASCIAGKAYQRSGGTVPGGFTVH